MSLVCPVSVSTHQPLYTFNYSAGISSSSSVSHKSPSHTTLPSHQLYGPPPLCSTMQPRVVYVCWNLGSQRSPSWLFLIWGGSPLNWAPTAKHIMFSYPVPKYAPSKLIDGKIILGGIKGWEVKESQKDPEVRRSGRRSWPGSTFKHVKLSGSFKG